MDSWSYGDAYKRFPLSKDPYSFESGSVIQVHDLMNELPQFMGQADLIFCDPPWDKGHLSTFYSKAGLNCGIVSFEQFYLRMFECIRQISPHTCYLETGKQYLAEFILQMRKQYRYVTFYNSTYYHNPDNICYIVRGSNNASLPYLDGIDEEDIIKWICAHEEYSVIGDLCMGRGLVGRYAHLSGQRFVGTELNHKKLSVLVEALHSKEFPWLFSDNYLTAFRGEGHQNDT